MAGRGLQGCRLGKAHGSHSTQNPAMITAVQAWCHPIRSAACGEAHVMGLAVWCMQLTAIVLPGSAPGALGAAG